MTTEQYPHTHVLCFRSTAVLSDYHKFNQITQICPLGNL